MRVTNHNQTVQRKIIKLMDIGMIFGEQDKDESDERTERMSKIIL